MQPGYVSIDEYVDRLRSIVVVAMIEKPAAADAVEEILSVPGLDMILWGPLDYSLTLGRPGDTECAEVRGVGERVIAAAHGAGVRVRAEIESVEEAKYFLDLGVKDFGFAGDLRTLYRSLKADGAELRETFEAAG